MRRVIIILSILFITTLSACSDSGQTQKSQNAVPQPSQAPAEGFKSVSPMEAKNLIETRKDLIVLDCRTQQELKYGAIEGSQLVPFWAIMQNKLTLPKTVPIMLVCAVGGRSYTAGQILRRQGYREVYNLSGGISAWKKEGLPLKYQ